MPKYHICLSLFSCQQLAVIIPRHQRRGGEGRSRAGERHLPDPARCPRQKSRHGAVGTLQGLPYPMGAARGALGTCRGRHAPLGPKRMLPVMPGKRRAKRGSEGGNGIPAALTAPPTPRCCPTTGCPSAFPPGKSPKNSSDQGERGCPFLVFTIRVCLLPFFVGAAPKKYSFPAPVIAGGI